MNLSILVFCCSTTSAAATAASGQAVQVPALQGHTGPARSRAGAAASCTGAAASWGLSPSGRAPTKREQNALARYPKEQCTQLPYALTKKYLRILTLVCESELGLSP